MVTLFKPLLDRPAFIWGNRIGRTIDIGTQDGSLIEHGHRVLGIPFTKDADWLVRFDIDKWLLPNLVRGDAHRTPFKDGAFDTVVLGDILEHVINPVIVLCEADRISKQRIIVTLPFEFEWHKSLDPFHSPIMTKEQVIGVTLNSISQYSKCTDYVDEERFHHLPHIRYFDFFMIAELLNRGLKKKYKVNVCNYYHQLAPSNPNEASDMPYFGIIIDKSMIMIEQLKVDKLHTIEKDD